MDRENIIIMTKWIFMNENDENYLLLAVITLTVLCMLVLFSC